MADDVLSEYRRRIDFDDATAITHPADCSPDSCSLVGYTKDGELRYQEQTGQYPVIDESTPDWNPRGCSRQCSFTDATYGDERIEQPMRQTGERGSGEWEPISWEEAYAEIAEALIDAMEDNPQSIITEIPPGEGGFTYGNFPHTNFVSHLGGVVLDPNGQISDFDVGQHITFGKYNHGSSHDDWFNADLILVWHGNPAYSRNPSYHFLSEARYDGTEVVTIAPDFSPSAVHADQYVPVEPASDAALALGMCRTIVDEGLMDRPFVKEQTDLPFLVRTDTGRFLREADLSPDGSDQLFYLWDAEDGLVQAPRTTLELGDLEPVLEGDHRVEIDGEEVVVEPVFERLRDELERWDPASVREATGVHPDVVDQLARKVATGRTTILNSYNNCKVFHGDLITRAMCLLVALTGNWGKKGARGPSGFSIVPVGPLAESGEPNPFLAEAMETAAEWDLNDEEIAAEWGIKSNKLASRTVSPVFYWYRHCGYDEVWEDASLSEGGIPRSISSYLEESVEKGWWDGLDLPEADVDPSVALWVAGNTLRRTRGGTRVLLENLWPELDMIVTVDYRWSTTALYSDIVLPAAFHHEKEQFDGMTDMRVRFWSFANKVIEPRHDSKTELEIIAELAHEIEELADERGLETYDVPQGVTVDRVNDLFDLGETEIGELDELPAGLEETAGKERSYSTVYERATFQGGSGRFETPLTEADIAEYNDEAVDVAKDMGIFPEDVSAEEIREKGFVQYAGPGPSDQGLSTTHEVEDGETVPTFTQHTEDKETFPTLSGRAQFYVDHEWFLEADEALPTHKSPPPAKGGDRDTYPYFVTSGHNRHSTHGITLMSDTQMSQSRGEPHAFVSRSAAAEKGIEDGEYVRIYNSFGDITIQAKVASLPKDDQIIIYHAWDPYVHPEGKGMHHLHPGLIKPLHLAGDYGHLEYSPAGWTAQQTDRHTTVDFEPVRE